ncbi:MAG: hypothetical protein H6652_07050 [Ardenticatenaceae bacterium]|nr:hypothetical protein [Ardenticatenaceae bacterium]
MISSSQQQKQMHTCGETAVSTTCACQQQTNQAPYSVYPSSKQRQFVCCFFFGLPGKLIC